MTQPFRVPRLHGPLARPRNLRDVLARLMLLSKAHGPAFDNATIDEAVGALFPGWSVCGHRYDEEDCRHVYVLRHHLTWVGFGTFAETTKPAHPKTPDPDEMVNYLALLRTHSDRSPWYAVNGVERLEQLRAALTRRTLDRPIEADTAVRFLEIANARGSEKHLFSSRNHVDYMADIMRTDDITDPDGTLAAARTMEALGRYPHLWPPRPA